MKRAPAAPAEQAHHTDGPDGRPSSPSAMEDRRYAAKRAAVGMLVSLMRHSPHLAAAAADQGGLQAAVACLGDADAETREGAGGQTELSREGAQGALASVACGSIDGPHNWAQKSCQDSYPRCRCPDDASLQRGRWRMPRRTTSSWPPACAALARCRCWWPACALPLLTATSPSNGWLPQRWATSAGTARS